MKYLTLAWLLAVAAIAAADLAQTDHLAMIGQSHSADTVHIHGHDGTESPQRYWHAFHAALHTVPERDPDADHVVRLSTGPSSSHGHWGRAAGIACTACRYVSTRGPAPLTPAGRTLE